MKNLYLLIFFYSFFASSCSQSPGKALLKLNDSVACSGIPGQYYTIYLPDSIDRTNKLPVIFLFDPGAQAKTAISNYRNLADKYKVILACSYNSKNGPLEKNIEAADAMIADAIRKFPVDGTSLFYAGFSGGSRFAWYYATQKRQALGVIACGAFFPAGNIKFSSPQFNYSAISGEYDFNYTESIAITNQFSNQNIPFQYITFQGEHAWPPEDVFERALVWQLAQLEHHVNLRTLSFSLESEALEKSKAINNLIQSAWTLRNLCFTDENSCNAFEALIQKREFNDQFKKFQRSLEFEDSLKAQIADAVNDLLLSAYDKKHFTKPIKWWQRTIQSMDKVQQKSSDIFLINAAARVKSNIGIYVWELNRNMLKENHPKQALEAAEILILTYPENCTYHALKAESLMILGETDQAVLNYKRAVELGFNSNNPYLGKSQYLKELSLISP